MNNATVETTAASQQEQIRAFVMPKILPGDTVLWYCHGLRGAGKPEVVDVLKVSERSICIKTKYSQQVRQPVRHIDDPKLRLSAEQREHGAWDYTERHKINAALEERVAKLEQLINEPSQPTKGKDKS